LKILLEFIFIHLLILQRNKQFVKEKGKRKMIFLILMR